MWVSVPRDATVYNDLNDNAEDTGMSDTSNEDILAFDVKSLSKEDEDKLKAIETELKEYTATYREEGYTDTQPDVIDNRQVTNAATEAELKSNSTEWGNYKNNTYNITNESAKNYAGTWADGTYEKTASGNVLLSTGASAEFERGGIYDLAGNAFELTLESSFYADYPCAIRGGDCVDSTGGVTASYRDATRTDAAVDIYTFRVSLF